MSKNLIATSEKFNQERSFNQKLNTTNEIPYEEHYKWHLNSYTNDLPKLRLPIDYDKGMMKRIYNIATIKYGMPQGVFPWAFINFKLHDTISRQSVNYATLICERAEDVDLRSLHDAQKIGDIAIINYSISTSLVSCDGEYRNKFCRYADYVNSEKKYPDIWNELATYVDKTQHKRSWMTTYSIFSGTDSQDNTALVKFIQFYRLDSRFLSLAFFHIIYNEYTGISESHMISSARDIFMSNIKMDIEFIKELINKYGEDRIEKFRVDTSYVVRPLRGATWIRHIPLGYKTTPLNIKEIQNPLDLRYKPWREYIISARCNDLIINQITPGVPIALDFFIIKNTNKGLFDNKSQYERMKNSELAKSIIASLKEAQRSTYFASSDLGQLKNSKQAIQWVSNKFRKLHDKINDPIDFSAEEIVMSDVGLSFPTEHVGRTINDTVMLIKKSKTYDAKLGRPFYNYDIFAKHMFEICYNLLVINKHLKIVHGDLHLNNATIGFLYPGESTHKIVYRLDQDHQYTFSNNGYFSFLIDFSRSYINTEDYEVLRNSEFPDFIKLVNDYDMFHLRESQSLLWWYLQLFPNKIKYKEELLVLFKNHFYAVFKLMTCMDLYMFVTRLLALLQQQDFPINKRCFELLEKLHKMAEAVIATEMNLLIKDPTRAEKIISEDFPMETIIKKCFAEYNTFDSIGKDDVVTDFYCLDNKLDKSLGRYETFPDSLKYMRYYTPDGNTKDDDTITISRREVRETHEKRKIRAFQDLKFLSARYDDIN